MSHRATTIALRVTFAIVSIALLVVTFRIFEPAYAAMEDIDIYDITPHELGNLFNPMGYVTIVGSVVFAVISVLGFQLEKTEKLDDSLSELQNEEEQAATDLIEEDTDFATLWFVTQKRIDVYHQIATRQAKRSFISTQVATSVGFAIILLFGIIASQADNAAGAISAGAVGIVGGGLSAYIGATFMKSQADATTQLNSFFQQPVEFSRLLGAERLLENLESEQRAAAVQAIITSMMQSSNRPNQGGG